MHSVGSPNERKHVCSLGRICEPTSGYCAKPEVLTSVGILVKIITIAFLLHKQDVLLLQKEGNHWGRVCIGDRRRLPFGPRRAQVAGETETRAGLGSACLFSANITSPHPARALQTQFPPELSAHRLPSFEVLCVLLECEH